MAKINFYNIDNAEKAYIFTEIATHLGMTPFSSSHSQCRADIFRENISVT